jgi:hypothetical protein
MHTYIRTARSVGHELWPRDVQHSLQYRITQGHGSCLSEQPFLYIQTHRTYIHIYIHTTYVYGRSFTSYCSLRRERKARGTIQTCEHKTTILAATVFHRSQNAIFFLTGLFFSCLVNRVGWIYVWRFEGWPCLHLYWKEMGTCSVRHLGEDSSCR